MALQAAVPGDPPWPWYPYHPLNDTPWWPQHWDAPSDPKVLEVALAGYEEYYVIGVFVFVWDARKAAARALMAYRRWHRREPPEPGEQLPRYVRLHARVTSRKVDEYIAPWWEKP